MARASCGLVRTYDPPLRHEFHQVRLPGAYEPKNKTSSKTYRKGPCALHFVECLITTPSPLQNYQRWQTWWRRFADLCSRAFSKPVTSYTISCLPQNTGYAEGPNVSRTLLCHTDCTISSNCTFYFTCYWLWILLLTVNLFTCLFSELFYTIYELYFHLVRL